MVNVPTVGRVPNGATVESELPSDSIPQEINLYLDSPSFSLAKMIQDRIYMEFGKDTAQAMDASTVRLRIPQGTNPVDFLAKVEDLQIDVPSLA